MKRFFSIVALVVVVIAFGAFVSTKTSQQLDFAANYSHGTIFVGTTTLSALVSDTEDLRAKGLSGFSRLGRDQAMLFIFPSLGNWGFWMKDMNFSIDILWLDEDFRIITIEKSVAPSTYPKIFFPKSLARYVIELNAGTTDLFGVTIGDELRFSLKK